MKKIAIITPVPDVIEILIKNSIIRKSIHNKVAEIQTIDLREHGIGNYKQIDDTPFGGGDGMIMMAEPLINAIGCAFDFIGNSKNVNIIYPSPQGLLWNQNAAEKVSGLDNIIFICGHYKGIDERVIEKYVTIEYSVGDFIMTSGEIPAMMMLDSALRLVPGTLNNLNSALSDTFTLGLLDHPHYTQPRIVDGIKVPNVLLSGHHENISNWRMAQRENRTKNKRNDLWKKYLKMRDLENNNE